MKNIDLSFAAEQSHYKILIGEDLLKQEIFANVLKSDTVFIVSNETVAPLYLNTLKKALSGYKVHTYLLPDGEEFKTLDSWQLLLHQMISVRLRRNDTVIALGGGVIGDIAGFAAATLNRGMAIIQVPTTLLSQVDSSVGGKTAVNHPLGKNLIGAFHQPSLVVSDISTLSSLPKREYLCGISEIIKASIIADNSFFEWLGDNSQSILSLEQNVLAEMIEWACRIKADIVELDAKEQGVRAWLNLGHTFGHAIETCAGYGELLHGEAVAIGMCLAAKFSHQQEYLSLSDKQRIISLIQQFGLPTTLPVHLVASELANAMRLDKKNTSEMLTLVLPEKVGQVMIDRTVNIDEVEQFLIREMS